MATLTKYSSFEDLKNDPKTNEGDAAQAKERYDAFKEFAIRLQTELRKKHDRIVGIPAKK